MLTFLVGCIYAWAGLRILMLMDSLHSSIPHRWANGTEWRAWVLMVLWPLAVLVDLLAMVFEQVYLRWLRRGVRR